MKNKHGFSKLLTIDILTLAVNFSVQVKKMWKSPSWRQKEEEICVCPVCVSCPRTPVQLLHRHLPEEDVWRSLLGDLNGCPGLSQTQWTWSVHRRTSRPSFCPSHQSASWNLSSSVDFGFQLHKNRLIFLKRSFSYCLTHCCYHMGSCLRCQGYWIKAGNPPSDFRWTKWELIKLLLVTLSCTLM